jgi:hypothetical protein
VTIPLFSYYLAAGLSVGYLVLLVIAARSNLQLGSLQRWLMGTVLLALFAQAVHILHPEASQGPYAALFPAGLMQPTLAVYGCFSGCCGGARWLPLDS